MVSPWKILVTTSRNPTPKNRTFCNNLVRVIADAVRVNRGKMSNDEVAEKALENDADRVVIVERGHGGLGALKFFRIGGSGLVLIPPVVHIASVKLQREFGTLRVKPARSVTLSESRDAVEVLRVGEALSKFLSMSILSRDAAVETGSTLMCISRGKADRVAVTFVVEPSHVEVGPRIIVSSVEW